MLAKKCERSHSSRFRFVAGSSRRVSADLKVLLLDQSVAWLPLAADDSLRRVGAPQGIRALPQNRTISAFQNRPHSAWVCPRVRGALMIRLRQS